MKTSAQLGQGIYTIPDIAKIFNLPTQKVRRWVKDYWDERLSMNIENSYSWTNGKARAVNFHTLIELYVYTQLMEAGVTTTNVLLAHKELSNIYKTPFPFATNHIVHSLRADGRKVSFETKQLVYTLDGKRQFKLEFYKDFLEKLDFGDDNLVRKFWPNGKKSKIVLDPNHHFGQPVIDGTNIVANTIYLMYKGGDKPKFISYLYDIPVQEVKDAINYCEKAA